MEDKCRKRHPGKMESKSRVEGREARQQQARKQEERCQSGNEGTRMTLPVFKAGDGEGKMEDEFLKP